MAEADLTLVVLDLSEPVTEGDLQLIHHAEGKGLHIVVGNKADLPRHAEYSGELVVLSALTGEGIEELRRKIMTVIAPEGGPAFEAGFITSLRHEQLLRESAEALGKARAAAMQGIPHEMLLLDLYAALRPIDSITGATTADDILNRIFSTFCIGK